MGFHWIIVHFRRSRSWLVRLWFKNNGYLLFVISSQHFHCHLLKHIREHSVWPWNLFYRTKSMTSMKLKPFYALFYIQNIYYWMPYTLTTIIDKMCRQKHGRCTKNFFSGIHNVQLFFLIYLEDKYQERFTIIKERCHPSNPNMTQPLVIL